MQRMETNSFDKFSAMIERIKVKIISEGNCVWKRLVSKHCQVVIVPAVCYRRLRLKCDCTRAETRFRLSTKWTSPFKSAGGVSSAEVCASAVIMLDTPCSEVVWRVLATHSIRQFPLHFPSCESPCAITFQLHCTYRIFPKPNEHNTRFCIAFGSFVVRLTVWVAVRHCCIWTGLTDTHFTCGTARNNSAESCRVYLERHPRRYLRHHIAFFCDDHRMQKTGTLQ